MHQKAVLVKRKRKHFFFVKIKSLLKFPDLPSMAGNSLKVQLSALLDSTEKIFKFFNCDLFRLSAPSAVTTATVAAMG